MIEIKRNIAGKDLIISTGVLARQATSSVSVRLGDTEVLATICFGEPRESPIDFVPLVVDYRERTYAAGKIPGGFFKREGKPTEAEILISRLVDRSIRPLFPKGLQNEVQVMITVLSSDQENPTDVPSIIGASTALLISGFPVKRCVSACKIGYKNDKFIFNPTISEIENSLLEVVISGTPDDVIMIEGKAKEFEENKLLEGIKEAQSLVLKEIAEMQNEIYERVSPEGFKFSIIDFESNPISKKAEELFEKKISKIYEFPSKKERRVFLKSLYEDVKRSLNVDEKSEVYVNFSFNEVLRSYVRKRILEENLRIDGRGPDDIRVIDCRVGLLPRTHGSALFTRGETQALVTTTLGTAQDMQIMDELEGVYKKRFMLHYNFPPFATGEVKPSRGPSRREIGHGALAERSIEAVLPDEDEFPYTIRVVSDILESNGSSSMASVCGATLSLMDAGVPLKNMVSGVAMGLVKELDKEVILTDILGDEDHVGDMDLKIAGTYNGVTGIQMDLKVEGLSFSTLEKAFNKAKEARLKILEKMKEAISSPRVSVSKYAPKIVRLKVSPSKIGEIIGPGGKTIKKIIEETEAKIEIEEGGIIYISADDMRKVNDAKQMIEFLIQDVELGKIYKGKVVRVASFGAFVEIFPGREGLCHISQIDFGRVNSIYDVVKEGDEILVKVINIDSLGRINLSRKEALRELGIRNEREYTDKDI
ncbi:MAG: polyribonucleotide nucleotidyltransferase [Caldiserica bacterium]|nr:MAG: polyribonucleotide nucleotidyltransferase [Caldisericota bacterium]